MRIGVDVCCWSNRRGFGRFTRELLTELLKVDAANEYYFFVDQQTATASEFPQQARVVVVPTSESPVEAASASGRRSLSDLWAMTWNVKKYDLDLFFFPAIYSYFPILNRVKVAVTIHDIIPVSFPESVFPNKKLSTFWNMKQYLALRQADAIVTVSNHSKQEILRHLSVPESKIHVLTEGPGADFKVLARDSKMEEILRQYELDLNSRYLLYVGGISPHKNLGTLVDVYSQLISEPGFSDLRLILVGDYEKDSFFSAYPLLKQKVEDLGLQEKVLFTGFVDDKNLAVLYNGATLFVLPSLMEGFGLPAVEAMACGAPVAASRAGSLPELIGDAGCLFDPRNPSEILGTIKQVLSNSIFQQQLRKKGMERVKQFGWTEAASRMLSLFHQLAQP